jgi:hypothetical protein
MFPCEYPLNASNSNDPEERAISGGELVYCQEAAVSTVYKPTWFGHNGGSCCAAHAEKVQANNSWYGTQAVLIPVPSAL